MATEPKPALPKFMPITTHRPPFMARNHVVSSGHYLASMAGFRILEAGGNAVDAGVAAGICINVLQPDMTDFGGVAPIILYLADRGEVTTISGLGRWPRKASVAYFKEHHGGRIPPGLARSVTPAAAGAWLLALEQFGTKSFAEVVAPALELAENGFPVHQFLHDNLAKYQEVVRRFPLNYATFYPRDRAPEVGETLVQSDLGRTFRRLSEVEAKAGGSREEGLRAARQFFYQGDMAREMAAFSQAGGGLLDYEDLAAFSPRVEPPFKVSFRGYEVYGCGPWCQGPVMLEALSILEGYDLRSLGHNSPEYLHLVISALEAAFADRHYYVGDPDFVKVPMEGLLNPDYAAEWRQRIDPGRGWTEMPEPGDPWRFQADSQGAPPKPARPQPMLAPPGLDTSYCCAVDRWGNGFSCTPSDGITSTSLVPGLGFAISSRGVQSWVDETHPAGIAGGKRPRLTPNPALVLKDGKLEMVFGTPGGDVQPQTMTQVLLAILEFGMDPQTAIERPRLATYNFPASGDPHPYYPGRVQVEGRIPPEVREALARTGREVGVWSDWFPTAGAPCAIRVDRESGVRLAGADPRRMSYAVGW